MLSALPSVDPAYRLYGAAADDPLHQATLQLVSLLEQIPNHPAADEVRSRLVRDGVVVPIRRGQLSLALADSATAHYDALISSQQHDIVAWTPAGFGPPSPRTKKPKEHHVLRAGDAREQLAALTGLSDAYLCPNEFKGWRRRSLLKTLNCLYVDVDFHDEGEVPSRDVLQMVAEEKIGLLHHAQFPLPSIVVFSGRGFHLYWCHAPLPESELARWSEIQSWLQVTLDSDPRATDATRYLRLIGSVHGRTGTRVDAERIGPAYDFDGLYRRWLLATGRTGLGGEEALAEAEAAQESDATPAERATVLDLNITRARLGEPIRLQRGIYHWFDAVYRDLRRIIEANDWKGKVPEGHRNSLLYHLAVSLSWFTRADALADEIIRENAEMVGLPPTAAKNATMSILRNALATQSLQAKAAEAGDLRYRLSRQRLWRDLSPIIPEFLLPQLRAIIPDDLWAERQRLKQSRRNRVAEGRYQRTADELRALQAARRDLAVIFRAQGRSWASIGESLGISADSARKLAGRAT